MIPRDRTRVTAPPSLATTKEPEKVSAAFADHCASGNAATDFSFEYKAYAQKDVKAALNELFEGKCAYCEARYAATQPMDVEHWRPKGAVVEHDVHGVRKILPGYHWLASTWTNLLPSCNDCNRPRTQRDAVTGVTETRGKGTQFPVQGARMKAPTPAVPDPPEDDALILDPTRDDPSAHLSFHDDGSVRPRDGSVKGAESIRVYALNRSELAVERLALARLVEQRLDTLARLAQVISAGGLPLTAELDLKDLVSHELNALHALARPDRPYSEMVRQIIAQNTPDGA